MPTRLNRRAFVAAPFALAAFGTANCGLANPQPLLTFDLVSRREAAPMLVIHADGAVDYRDREGRKARAAKPLTEDALNAIMRQLRDEYRVQEIDTAAIEAEIKRRTQSSGLLFSIMDANTTKLTVRMGDRTHDLSFYATGPAARQFPGIESLQRLAKAEAMLRDIALSYQSR
jgi:hypothetical protein